jgi:hypothetical protein
MYRIRAVLHVILITVVVGLAISYATLLSDLVPDLNFLESIGIYCLSLPLTQLFKSMIEPDEE